MQFSYLINPKKDRCAVALYGALLDKLPATALLNEVDSLLADGISYFILDLSGLHYINSSGLNALIAILTKSRIEGGDTVVINVPEKIKSLLIATKLSTVFTIAENKKAKRC